LNRTIFTKYKMKPLIVFSTLSLLPLLAFAEAKKPNVVFIFSDDHATQAISAYGSKINHTPNIDRIAE